MHHLHLIFGAPCPNYAIKWNNFGREHLRIIPVKFGQNPMIPINSFRGHVDVKILTQYSNKDTGQRPVTNTCTSQYIA